MIPPASRMTTVSYSIRRVVAEARKAEAAGRKIFYLNTGDPVHAGFQPPAHMVEAVHAGAAQRRARLRTVCRFARGARSGSGREYVARLAGLPRSRRHDIGVVRRDRFRAHGARRSRRRSAGASAHVSALHRDPAQDRRARDLLPDRSEERLAARSKRGAQPHHATDPGNCHERPEQPDWSLVRTRDSPGAAEDRR